MKVNFRHHVPVIVGLFVALGLPFVFSVYLGSVRDQLADPSRVVQAIGREWGIALLLLAVILFWERRPLSSIGLRKMSWRDALWGVAGFVLGGFTFIITTPVVQAFNLGTTGGGIAQLATIPIGLRVAIVLTAAITEEILFRGYPIERLTELTGHIGLGAGIAYFAFVALHIPFWGLGGAVQIGVWTLVVTGLYLWRRNLPTCMLMHALNDAYAFILLPTFLAQYLPTQ